MDAFDIRILRTMGIRPFARWPRDGSGIRPATIATHLGEVEQTVRDRITRLESSGVVRGYHLMPNLKHVGLDAESVHWELDAAPGDETMARLQAVDGVIAALRFYGPHVCFDLTHTTPDQRRRRLEVLGHLFEEPHDVLWAHDLAFPDVDRELSTLDWKIIRERRRAARRPATEVAEAVGVTAKTVRTRYDAMREEGSFEEYASIDFAAMSDSAPFILYVWFSPDGPDPMTELLELLEPYRLGHFRATVPESGMLVTQLVASNPAEVQTLAERAAAVDGVDQADPQLPTGGYWNEEWIDELVDSGAQVTPV